MRHASSKRSLGCSSVYVLLFPLLDRPFTHRNLLVVIYLMVLLTLVNRAQSQGFNNIWYSHIAYVPWFGEWISGAYPMYPGMAPQQPYYYQQPGRSLVIQPGVDGAAPMVTSVPT